MTTADVRQQAIEALKKAGYGWTDNSTWEPEKLDLGDRQRENIVDILIAAGVIRETDNTGDDAQSKIDSALKAITDALDGPNMTIDGKAAVQGVLCALTARSSGEVDTSEIDQRITAWEAIANHPVFKTCYDQEGPLIASILDRLDLFARSSGVADTPETEREKFSDTALDHLREQQLNEGQIIDWFASHSSAAINRVTAAANEITKARFEDGVFE